MSPQERLILILFYKYVEMKDGPNSSCDDIIGKGKQVNEECGMKYNI